jgi:molybdate transport system substrate-binding protein
MVRDAVITIALARGSDMEISIRPGSLHRPAIVLAWGLVMALAHRAPVSAQAASPSAPGRTVTDEIRALVTAAIRFPPDLVAAAEKTIGKRIVVQYGSARGNLKDAILGGQQFEVAILLPDVNEEVFRAGKILPETHEIGRVPIAFGLRGDVPAVDVSTPAAVKTTFLNAKSIKYAPTGAALLTVRKVLNDLGIADQIRDASAARAEVPLGPGEYEINIYPLSEIIPNRSLKNLGAVIPALQVPSILQAVVGAHANDPSTARALITFLQGPAVDQLLKDSGIVKSVTNATLR